MAAVQRDRPEPRTSRGLTAALVSGIAGRRRADKVPGEMSRQQRAAVAAETARILRGGDYPAPPGRRVDLRADVETAVARTRLYPPHELPPPAAEPTVALETRIEVTGESTLAATRRPGATTDGEVVALNVA